MKFPKLVSYISSLVLAGTIAYAQLPSIKKEALPAMEKGYFCEGQVKGPDGEFPAVINVSRLSEELTLITVKRKSEYPFQKVQEIWDHGTDEGIFTLYGLEFGGPDKGDSLYRNRISSGWDFENNKSTMGPPENSYFSSVASILETCKKQ